MLAFFARPNHKYIDSISLAGLPTLTPSTMVLTTCKSLHNHLVAPICSLSTSHVNRLLLSGAAYAVNMFQGAGNHPAPKTHWKKQYICIHTYKYICIYIYIFIYIQHNTVVGEVDTPFFNIWKRRRHMRSMRLFCWSWNTCIHENEHALWLILFLFGILAF